MEEIESQCRDVIPCSNSIPIATYFKKALDLNRLAASALATNDYIPAYIYFKRFISLVVHTIPNHNAYKQLQYKPDKTKCNQLCSVAIDNAEKLKPIVMKEVQAIENEEHDVKEEDVLIVEDSKNEKPEIICIERDTKDCSCDGLPDDIRKLSLFTTLPAPISVPLMESKPPYPNFPASKISSSSKFVSTPKSTKSLIPLKPIVLPRTLAEDFLTYAASNTQNNIETCGILTGVFENNQFIIKAVILPKQNGSANTVVTTNEEELINIQIERDYMTIGWIHTHPTQEAFLSSVDMHTQYLYQLMIPESIAIVCAPCYRRIESFSLTPKGMSILKTCAMQGFHQHAENEGLFDLSSHSRLVDDRTVEFIDLRAR